ncbi:MULTISPECIES: response regulator [Ramlibacter]|uniref:Response regulator n=1 Tax=Ramlibacter pinisoli TaxID=2682844 RepID=A0A6N8IVY9_9BURK|nr:MULTISPECIES: response regulator [Ramlibacter]MBA2961180.1 response regulator [Ramlibacter sp. CGMCC 1.13660]MVQ31124.1 response regulator [Ramlibacter pinisoli]
MGQRVFVKVVGFDDVERHALNTLFRVSGDSGNGFALWTPETRGEPGLALIDSESYEARVEFESPLNDKLRMVWVGPHAPARAWRSFQRPLRWPEVIAAMDELFRPVEPLDFDLDVAEPASGVRRALIASPDRAERLYLRARLALAGITQADEAETGPQAMELVRNNRYQVAFIDFGLPGLGGWDLVRQVTAAQPRIPVVVVTKDTVSTREHMKAHGSGVALMLAKPPHPTKIKALLEKV